MPALKRRMIFISHAWQYNEHYYKLVGWFDKESNFLWRNCSVPSHDALPDNTKKGLEKGITKQIRPAQIIIILGGMYAAHSNWIDYEIQEAQRMEKLIIGIKPWGQRRVPRNVQNSSSIPMVSWNRENIIKAVRELV